MSDIQLFIGLMGAFRMTPTTPQQISDYKQQWMSQHPFAVELHSDYRSAGKDWCKTFLMRHQYVFKQYTNVYEDTWFFENQIDAGHFTTCIKKYFEKYAEVGVPGP